MRQIKATQKRVQTAGPDGLFRSIGAATDKSRLTGSLGKSYRDEEIGPNGLTAMQDQQIQTMRDELTRKNLDFKSLQ